MNATDTYAQMGIAALIPGMQYTLDKVQEILDGMRAELNRLQGGAGVKPRELTLRLKLPEEKPNRRRMSAAGRAAIAEAQKRRWAAHKAGQKPKRGKGAQAAYWAKMTPEERKAEMVRRQNVHARKMRKSKRAPTVAQLRKSQQVNGEAVA